MHSSTARRLDDTDIQVNEATAKEAAPSGKSATAFRTISEVADELDVQQHVLRFWETKFTQVKPLKRGGGRRYYRPEDIAVLKKIHHLLYAEGYTIKGVQKLLKGQGKQQVAHNREIAGHVVTGAEAEQGAPVSALEDLADNHNLSDKDRALLQAMIVDLKDIRAVLEKVQG